MKQIKQHLNSINYISPWQIKPDEQDLNSPTIQHRKQIIETYHKKPFFKNQKFNKIKISLTQSIDSISDAYIKGQKITIRSNNSIKLKKYQKPQISKQSKYQLINQSAIKSVIYLNNSFRLDNSKSRNRSFSGKKLKTLKKQKQHQHSHCLTSKNQFLTKNNRIDDQNKFKLQSNKQKSQLVMLMKLRLSYKNHPQANKTQKQQFKTKYKSYYNRHLRSTYTSVYQYI